jgi:Uma2 family endonuclease
MSEAVALPPPVTVAAFDAFLAVQTDDTSWELIAGEIRAMTNPSVDHEEIVGNISTALRPVMPADRRCRIAVGGLRVQMSDDEWGTYSPRADVMVWCGPKDGKKNFVTMPLIIVEVLSPLTMDSDRGPKLRFYKTGLQTLRHIALVYQDQMRVENYRRTDVGWEMRTLIRPTDALSFEALLFSMPLSDVYGGVTLPAG